MSKRILNYAELKEEYEKLKNDKSEVIELYHEINRLKKINKILKKDNIELSCLVTELMKRK